MSPQASPAGAKPARPERTRRLRHLLAVAGIAAGIGLMIDAGWIHAKAALAQTLIERAWQDNVATGRAEHRPWGWADTVPVGRLEFVRQHASMVVLAGDSGRVLAFGPGHRTGTALPGSAGNSVISAHRDTHFKILRDIGAGDLIRVDTLDGRRLVYRVESRQVVDHRDLTVVEQQGIDQLTLVTCWPFDAITTRGPERLVVTATRLQDAGFGPRSAQRKPSGAPPYADPLDPDRLNLDGPARDT